MVELAPNVLSRPTTSAPWAMSDYPRARQAELDALCDLVRLPDSGTALDIQAAGGFVSDEIARRSAGRIHCLCVEPSAELRARIAPTHSVFDDEIDDLKSIPDETVDIAMGLAGLHHSRSIDNTLTETLRVLKPGGQLGLCDVEPESPVARWLNEFVNAHNPAGHHGIFIDRLILEERLANTGYVDIETSIQSVPWRFATNEDLLRFFRGLFGLQCDEETISTAIEDYFEISRCAGSVILAWRLIYARACKTRT